MRKGKSKKEQKMRKWMERGKRGAPLPRRASPSLFSPFYCGQTVAHLS